ncbi:hypothetical protein ACTMTJ_37385 [Phytohabitans sp. LJ34]|uniref:hypothetical protein n=1 Tax=Phytohabitans sp. LJ34 TaxID=3452217 RepID=UPI003F887151
MTSPVKVAVRIAAVLGVGIVTAVSAVAPSASAASENVYAADEVGSAGVHCYAVVRKLVPGQSESEVVDHGCVRAGQKLPPLVASSNGDGPHVLVRIFGDADYGCGWNFCYSLLGYDGPCDSAGYSFPNTGHPSFASLWSTASSWKVDSNCYWVHGFRERDYQSSGGWKGGNQAYIGDHLNDHLLSLRVTA